MVGSVCCECAIVMYPLTGICEDCARLALKAKDGRPTRVWVVFDGKRVRAFRSERLAKKYGTPVRYDRGL